MKWNPTYVREWTGDIRNPILGPPINMYQKPTLILTPRFTDDSQQLWRAAESLGWETVRLHGWQLSDDLKAIDQPVVYVEALMAPLVGGQLGLTLREPPENWLSRLPERYRKRMTDLILLEDARKLTDRWHIKPPNNKEFPAGIMTGSEIPEYAQGPNVLISEIVNFEKEFRCFVLYQHVRAASIYLRDGILQKENEYQCPPEELAEAVSFAQIVLSEVRVPDAVVMDVGYIEGRGWAVIELNAAWGSGLYGCDPAQVLQVLLGCMEDSKPLL